jgi:CubicO group peptidase (beta-lactamase class C family)
VFRVFSNTKLVTSCAVLLLLEEGRLVLDDPIERYIPQLGKRHVLRPGAASIDDAEPAKASITIRHLMSHSSGLSYGLLDPGTPMFKAYSEHRVLHPGLTLPEMMDTLADLPLSFEPGTAWEYSVATDVLGRLVEVVSGQRLDAFFRSRIFKPLGMVDTMFTLPPEQHHRLVAYYAGADVMQPMLPGLTRSDQAPYPGAYLRPFPKLSGGGGLVSTLGDMVALLRSLLPDGPTLLQPATIAQMMRNQLPDGVCIGFPDGVVHGKGFGLAGAVTLAPSAEDPPQSTGELQWGGIAGTHWWISPKTGLAGLLMTQRQMAFWHPFAFEFKRLAYRAVLS